MWPWPFDLKWSQIAAYGVMETHAFELQTDIMMIKC